MSGFVAPAGLLAVLPPRTPKVLDAATGVYWANQGVGKVLTDTSGHRRHGQLGGTSVPSTADPTWVDEGLSFDGIDDIVHLPSSLRSDTGTVLIAFTMQAVPAVPMVGLLGVGSQGFDNNFWIGVRSDGRLQARARVGNEAAPYRWNRISVPSINFAQPTFVAVVQDGTGPRFYIGEDEVAIQSTEGNDVSVWTSLHNTSVYLSMDVGYGRAKYVLYALAFFDRALSPVEIAEAHGQFAEVLARRGVLL